MNQSYTLANFGFVVGILPTLSGIISTFLILLHHPEYQERAQKELDDVIGPDRLPRLDDRQNCPLLEAIITEATRYIPIVPLLVSHYTSSDVEFEGYHIPAGSHVSHFNPCPVQLLCGECQGSSACTYVQSDFALHTPVLNHKFLPRNPIQRHLYS